MIAAGVKGNAWEFRRDRRCVGGGLFLPPKNLQNLVTSFHPCGDLSIGVLGLL